MATRIVTKFEEQTGITVLSDEFIVEPTFEVSVVVKLISGTPATGARVQVTLDETDKIKAGTATWVSSSLGNRLTSSAEKVFRPITGIRLSVTDGTWGLQVRQS